MEILKHKINVHWVISGACLNMETRRFSTKYIGISPTAGLSDFCTLGTKSYTCSCILWL